MSIIKYKQKNDSNKTCISPSYNILEAMPINSSKFWLSRDWFIVGTVLLAEFAKSQILKGEEICG